MVHEFPLLQQPQHQRRPLAETIRRTLSAQVYDLIAHSQLKALAQAQPDSVDVVRAMPPLLAFSEGMRRQSRELKRFLFANLYRHPQVPNRSQGNAGIARPVRCPWPSRM